MTNPMVSVVLPTYNRKQTVRRAIDSVLNQTYRNFELIIVDDGSDDGTYEMLQELGLPRTKVVRLEHNAGPSVARNRGISVASGKYVAFQDSDDQWLPDKLEMQIDLLEAAYARNFKACFSRYALCRGGESILIPANSSGLGEGDILQVELFQNVVGTPVLLVERSVLLESGCFDETLRSLEDWDLVIRLSLLTQFKFIDKVLHIAHWTPGGVNQGATTEVVYSVISKHVSNYMRHCPSAGADLFWSIGHSLARAGNIRLGRKAITQSLQMKSLNHRRVALIATRLGPRFYRLFASIPEFVRKRQAEHSAPSQARHN